MFVSKKSILVSKAPNQFPSCWFHIPDENDPLDSTEVPSYDLELTKAAMDATIKLCNSVKNVNSEDEKWEKKILMYGWSPRHVKLFSQIVKILDYDRLARLANVDNKRYEAVHRRTSIDKSADRMRKCLASVAWDTNTVQWIHGLLMEYMPPSYLAAYLDIMQSLKLKLPSLVDKMIFWKPGNVHQELLAPILKRPWHPILTNKYRKLPGNTLLVVIPSAAPRLTAQSSRIQKLYTLFTTMAPMLPITLTLNNVAAHRQSLQSIAEQTVSITRSKIQELKAEHPDRRLILVGMNSASALAMQVALVEQVSGIICFGFSYNTVHGVRGQNDDHFLDLSTPTMFLIGQNSARSSEEEIDSFCEKIAAQTSTVVVGSADDFLRLSKTKRRLEGVTQEMVDNMIVDEMADFATKCLQRPLPAKPKTVVFSSMPRREIDSSTGLVRKRKISNAEIEGIKATKAQKLMKPTSTSDDVLEMAVASILPDHDEKTPIRAAQKLISATRVQTAPQQRLKQLPQSHQSTPRPSMQTKYITITGPKGQRITQAQARAAVTSRPATPTSQTHFIVTNRQSTGVRVPAAQQQQQQQQQSFSPTKYTIVRTSNSSQNIVSESSTEISGTNIFDMPIVFADNEGNIDEEVSQMSDGSVISIASDSPPLVAPKKMVLKTTTVTPSSAPQSFTITKNRNMLIQNPKTFTINGTVIGKQVVLPKAQTAQLKVQKNYVPVSKAVKPALVPTAKRIEILNNQIITPAMTSAPKFQTTSFVNLADSKQYPGGARLSLPTASTSKNQIVIKTNALKPYTGGTQFIPSTISGTKQLGNLTVKRLNVVPGSQITKVMKKN